MNKKNLVIALAIVATLGGTGAAIAKDAVNQGNMHIGVDKAKAIALQKVNGVVTSIELEREDGQVYYEVEVRQKNNDEEFDVHVEATTGKVLGVVADDDDDRQIKKQPSHAKKQTTTISVDHAKKLALQAVSGQVVKVEKDREDGVLVYEIKIKTSKGIAEVEIAAANGKLVSIDYDNDHDHDDDHDDDYDDRDE